MQALHPAYLLLEVAGEPVMEQRAEVVDGLPGVLDAALADDPRGRTALWAWRESHTECINSLGPPVKTDVPLPLRALADFIEYVPVTVRAAHGGGPHAVVRSHRGRERPRECDGNVGPRGPDTGRRLPSGR